MKIVEGKTIYSVSEVNNFARLALEQMVFWLEAEVSQCDKSPGYNFYYLALKDDFAVLPAIVDGYLIENFQKEVVGQKILAFGFLSLYEPRGQYQFRINRLEVAGEGILQKKLEELIRKLKSEGLFDPKHKKPIPLYPRGVCLVTSYGKDAYNDFKRHTVDKFSIITLYVADVRVQGKTSVNQLRKVLPATDKQNYDVVVITRGGGSLEDLAAFNDEHVARIIFKMKTPTVVAIGHETNESLAEWVADARASTPTDAANVVTSGYQDILHKLDNYRQQLKLEADYYFSKNFQDLDYLLLKLNQLKFSLKEHPYRLERLYESLQHHRQSLFGGAKSRLKETLIILQKESQLLFSNYQQRVENLNKSLLLLSPRNTLERGYSITFDAKNRIIKSIKSIAVGQVVGVKLANGKFSSMVKSVNDNE